MARPLEGEQDMIIKRRDLLTGLLLGGAALCALVPAGLALAHEYDLGKLTIEHPWVRAPKDGETTAYFYAFIHNKGDKADKLIAVRSPNVGKTVFHADASHAIADGGIAVPPGVTTTLSPAGAHVVLVEVKKINPVGWGMELVLVFEKAGEVTVDAAVDAPDAAHAHDAEAMARWEKAHPDGYKSAPAGEPHGHHDHGDHHKDDAEKK
jgi:copper(I)-binding protein